MFELLSVCATVLVPARVLECVGEREHQRRRLPDGFLLRLAVLIRVRPRVAELERQCERIRAQLRKCLCFNDAHRVSFGEQLTVAVALCFPDAHTSRNLDGLTLRFLVWFRVRLAVRVEHIEFISVGHSIAQRDVLLFCIEHGLRVDILHRLRVGVGVWIGEHFVVAECVRVRERDAVNKRVREFERVRDGVRLPQLVAKRLFFDDVFGQRVSLRFRVAFHHFMRHSLVFGVRVRVAHWKRVCVKLSRVVIREFVSESFLVCVCVEQRFGDALTDSVRLCDDQRGRL